VTSKLKFFTAWCLPLSPWTDTDIKEIITDVVSCTPNENIFGIALQAKIIAVIRVGVVQQREFDVE